MTRVADLISRLDAGGDDGARAAMDLGRLMQGGGIATPDGGRPLAESERLAAVDGLIRHVYTTPRPEATAVWALGASGDRRAVAPLASALERCQDDPSAQDAALQAISALAHFGGPDAQQALVNAAHDGTPEVAAAAGRAVYR